VQKPIRDKLLRFASSAAACALFAACAGTVKEGMAKLEGQPLSAAIGKIGLPLDELTVGGKKVYIWGGPKQVDERWSTSTKKATCVIRATMNGDVIESFDYQGDETLCHEWAARLRS
jgi:hypothetical protein